MSVAVAPTTTLDAIRPGGSAEVVSVLGDDTLARRLADFGFWPGTVVSVLRRAPMGDPTQYRLRGYRVALRRGEAARVEVIPR